ncbi:MAG TPA: hypothetical protein VGG48_09870 [Rhizomicrobium sp.]|jgi:hypothetical protein
MRSIVFMTAAALALCGTSAFAADDIMAGFYGNTAVATGGMADTHTTYSPDHTFTTKVPSFNMTVNGTWKMDGANLCRHIESPPMGVPADSCVPMTAHKVGDTWSITTNGQTRTITLLKGIQ